MTDQDPIEVLGGREQARNAIGAMRSFWQSAPDEDESWLGDFGLFAGAPPDACARLDLDRFAFRIDSGDRSIVVIVTVDYDADGTPGEGWTDLSRAVRVEVVRAS
jgi:hypothetical protein